MTEPLSIRMLQAAKIIEEFNTVYSDIYNLDAAWRPSELRREADHRAAEETEAAERDQHIEELAHLLASAEWAQVGHASRGYLLTVARRVIESGWRKGEPDE